MHTHTYIRLHSHLDQKIPTNKGNRNKTRKTIHKVIMMSNKNQTKRTRTLRLQRRIFAVAGHLAVPTMAAADASARRAAAGRGHSNAAVGRHRLAVGAAAGRGQAARNVCAQIPCGTAQKIVPTTHHILYARRRNDRIVV